MTDDSAPRSPVERSTSDTTLWYWIAVVVIMFMAVFTVMALLTAAGT